jgi:hypothetical protein
VKKRCKKCCVASSGHVEEAQSFRLSLKFSFWLRHLQHELGRFWERVGDYCSLDSYSLPEGLREKQ